MDIKNRVLEIQKLISINKFSQAILDCEKLIKKFPENSYFYNLCGLALQKSDQTNKSIKYFKKAISLEPTNFAAMNNLANSYKGLFEYKKAEDLYIEIKKKDPTNIKVLNNYANLKKEFNKYHDAINLLLDAIKVNAKDVNVLSNIAACFQSIGDMNKAKEYALKVLDLEPNNTHIHKFISDMLNYRKDKNHLNTMRELLHNSSFKNFASKEKADLYFALGKAHEDIGDFENSYYFLNKANLNMKENKNYNFFHIQKLFNNIFKLFNSLDDKILKKKQSKKRVIFICGMPRSGTTLVEQIIASHSKVSGAGELQYLEKVINENFLEDAKFNKQKIIEELSNEKNIIFERYFELLNFHNFDTDIVTDKAPQNFIWIGFIKFFFPNSKIIHCSRNPKDNCLSIFKNQFSSNTMSWSYDQTLVAKYYNLYLEMMNFWKLKYNDFIFDANYEKIVTSPESEVKKMLLFCDLNWESECLNFYQNKKTPVQTASVSQASKPIYKSSINTSSGFSKYLSEMFEILDTKS
ncbi:tetratricopeptide repeat-containing sulfotransferase family protein [Candidatus Pelagibacter bacterium nBUS_27]|uniref:tetratricopeptide repeat-containing sulfotransferase family protein n=1 Tax=Candidatus Pelagibacter bacterium nBUS_27 TaxID=3374188 RepID=UPI003EC11814